jgi:diguanylate cyclase (GGDEF)-like protein/PAS domain S-box-containing protein
MIDSLTTEEILNTLAVGVVIVNQNEELVYVNELSNKITGYSIDDFKNVNQWFAAAYPDPDYREKVKNNFRNKVKNKESYNRILQIFDKNNEEKYIEFRIKPLKNDHIMANIIDVNEKKKRQKKIEYLSFHDELTGLYNRHYLQEELKKLNKSRKHPISLIIGDLDNLKAINDNFGHLAGDKYIKKAANIIKSLLRNEDIIARVGGDEFVIVLPNTTNKTAEFITKRIREKFKLENKKIDRSIKFDISLGISTAKNKKNNLIDCYHFADQNMYENKNNKTYICFNQEKEKKIRRKNNIEKELKKIIKNEDDKLYLEFQPMLDLNKNKVITFEALARMNSKKYGILSPEEFINIAEERHLIIGLSNLILKKASKFSAKLDSLGYEEIKISVNMSAIDIIQKNFTENVINIIKNNKARPKNINLEITESVVLKNFAIINSKLNRLQKTGITTALDDFGTGYSSLDRLAELNIDIIKLDKNFIDKIINDKKEKIIVDAIINMSHKLGLKVVAEGVELQAEKEYLIKHHCDIIQGYLFNKPLSENDAIAILK